MAELNGWTEVKAEESVGFQWTKVGESIEGKLKNVVIDAKFNNKRYFVDTAKGEISFFGSSVLNTRLAHVLVGDLVKIEYLGEVKSKQGRMFKDFKVFTKKEGPVPGEEVVR